jgi:hypothetical protein
VIGWKPKRKSKPLPESMTRLGWMERNNIEASQWHCEACTKFFSYEGEHDTPVGPPFCPECGRINAKKSTRPSTN